MAETKIYIPDELDRELREQAMSKFGYGRGSISSAAAEAITQWVSKENGIKRRLQAIVEMAKTDKEAEAVLLFGSYARKEPNYRDIDVAIVLKDKKNASQKLMSYLKAANPEGDLEVQVVIFNNLSLDIQRRVLNESKILYISDKAALYEKSAETIRKWSDFEYIFNGMIAVS
jgi:predicted nucleotidyltransferase